jgi:hypothetical protein
MNIRDALAAGAGGHYWENGGGVSQSIGSKVSIMSPVTGRGAKCDDHSFECHFETILLIVVHLSSRAVSAPMSPVLAHP